VVIELRREARMYRREQRADVFRRFLRFEKAPIVPPSASTAAARAAPAVGSTQCHACAEITSSKRRPRSS
jgi:hypothetical protein